MSVELDVQGVLAIVVPIASALGIVVWWVMRKTDQRIDAERLERIADREMYLNAYREERNARESFFRTMEQGRASDRHDSRDELAKVANDMNLFRERVIREHPTYDRLGEIMRPLTAGMEDVKAALERVFERLDGKADKLTRSAGHG